jgi:hypothetical protein
MGDEAIRTEIIRRRSQSFEERAAEAEAERLAWAQESVARLRATA